MVRIIGPIFGGQQNGFRNGNTQLNRQRVIEKFLVGSPPKRVVHDGSAGEGRVFQKGFIKRHILRNPVDNYGVVRRDALLHASDVDKFGFEIALFLVYPIHKRLRKGVFLTKQNTNFG